MYRHNQGKSSFPSSKMSIPQERNLLVQGRNDHGDSGLVLSTDAKPRLKWTSELHERFIEAVNQLGGADKATPKTIMKFMGVPGLTLYHLKSHLQKYRLSKNLYGQANNGSNKNAAVAGDRMIEVSGAFMSKPCFEAPTNKSSHISETLQMQMEVQRKLHEQLEVQRHLQLRIEAQGKYLQSVLEKAQETLGRQNMGSIGLEAAQVQLSELISKASTECLNSSFSVLKEPTHHPTDCSVDSCLTSCEGSQKDQQLGQKEIGDESRLERTEPTWFGDLNDNKMFPSSLSRDRVRMMFPAKRSFSDVSMSISGQGEKGCSNSSTSEARLKERDGEDNFINQGNGKRPEIISKEIKTPFLTANLDLNAYDINDAAFDLNGFRWN